MPTKEMIMKKLVTALALCAAVSAYALESSNTVGYEKTTLKSGEFNMVAGSFLGLGGTGWKLNVNFTGTNLKGSSDPNVADQILVWNAQTGGYTTYFWFDTGTGFQWANAETYGPFEDDYPTGAPVGLAFWFLALPRTGLELDPSVNFAGEVPVAATYTFNLKKGEFNMIANPYPTALKLNNTAQMEVVNAVGSSDPNMADQILVWNAQTGGYTTYFWFDTGTGFQWANAETYGPFEDDYVNGKTGFNAWYLALAGTGTVDLTFKKNF
jgi:hypothetical protein